MPVNPSPSSVVAFTFTCSAGRPSTVSYTHLDVYKSQQQQAAATFLDEYPVASVKDIGYFTGVKLGTLRAMETKGIVTLTRQERYRLVDGAPVEPALPPELNEEQQAAYDGICQMLGSPGCCLLYTSRCV